MHVVYKKHISRHNDVSCKRWVNSFATGNKYNSEADVSELPANLEEMFPC